MTPFCKTCLSILMTGSMLAGCATPADKSATDFTVPVPVPDETPPPPPPPPPPPAPVVMAPAPPAAELSVARSRVGAVMPGRYAPVRIDRERYKGEAVAPIKRVAEEPVSTFSVDVDTGSYANVRRFLTADQLPPMGAVRTEEMLNYFRYDYPLPRDKGTPFSVTTDMAVTPWNAKTRLLRIGINGYDIAKSARPATNLVFLVDVSGSMDSPDKLPLVKQALSMLADKMTANDKVSIVVYAGTEGLALAPTSDPNAVKAVLDKLGAGGSTAGGAGLALAYKVAKDNFIKGGVNRVMLATDGDFNVGIQSNEGIEQIVKVNRDAGITLSTLGFGTGNYNEAMMERIADVGNGNYSYIDGPFEAQKVLADEMAGTIFTIAKDVKIQVEFNPAVVSEYRLIGYENRALREEDFANDKVDAGDIGSGHQVTALYELVPAGAAGWLPERRYDGNRKMGKTGPANELAFVKLRYKLPDGDTSKLIERAIPRGMMSTAGAARGDMAFAASVAAFGQKLRGDNLVAGFDWEAIKRLAGTPWQPVRKQYVDLIDKAAALAAKTPIPPYEAPLPSVPRPFPRPMPMACGAEMARGFVGQAAKPEVRAKVAAQSGARSLRWIEPGMAVTMDYRPDRLNARLSAQGIITSLTCG